DIALSVGGNAPPSAGRVVAHDLRRIGIHIRVKQKGGDLFSQLSDPARRGPIALDVAFSADYPNASTFIPAQFESDEIPAVAGGGNFAAGNYSLVGASPSELRSWGYSVRSVPDVDRRIHACEVAVGSDQVHCWASLDQYLT